MRSWPGPLALKTRAARAVLPYRPHRRHSTALDANTQNLPLAGLRILDLSRVLAGPFCTQILSDYGASVVKVEQPQVGDETRSWRAPKEAQMWKDDASKISLYFSAVNRNKRSMTLNLKSRAGVEIARRIACESDVLIHNFLPGTAEAMGLGYEELKKDNKRLIYASISGYGTNGPNRSRPGYDAIALAEAGLLHVTGQKGGPPLKPGVAIADMCTGLYTHGAILAALAQRQTTGLGTNIEGSLFETGLSLLINVGLNALNLDTDGAPEDRRRGQRWGLEHPSLVPYGGFETQDGKTIFIAANNDRQWKILCEKTGLAHLLQDVRFSSNDGRLKYRDEINQIVQDQIKRQTKEEWHRQLENSGLPYGAINDVVEALEHPQSTARDMVMNVSDFEASRDGNLNLIAPAIKFADTQMGVRFNPPKLGEHTDEVLCEIGYCAAEIKGFRETGVI